MTRDEEIETSWERNAGAWTSAVREGRIGSRRAGTDAAIVRACERLAPRRVLDVGCGEGWLARVLAGRGADVLGVDASAPLVDLAREAGGGPRYEVASYDDLMASPGLAAGPWDVVVCNFALLGERIEPLLRALAARLAPGGTLLVQTVHPWSVAAAAPPYADGWRTETFAAMAGDDAWTPMPWYFRTLASWVAELRGAGLAIAAVEEPRSETSPMPLSLILECRAASHGGA